MIAIRLEPNIFTQGRDSIIKKLMKLGIETRPGFYSASMMDHLYSASHLPVSEELSRNIISLPSSPILTNEDIKYICDCLISLQDY